MERARKNENKFLPMIAIPPGETIKEFLEELKMTQVELSTRLGITQKHLSNIIKGNSPITYETALKLEIVIGPSAEFWINLENNYQLDKARLEEEKLLKEDFEILKKIPYNDLCKLSWVKESKDKHEKVKNCREFFKVANLGAIQNSSAVAFRLAKAKKEISNLGVLAWLTKAEEFGSKIEVSSLNRNKLKSLIPIFRELSCEDPRYFFPKMKELCAQCGIALVLVESLPKTYINGATIWKGDKAILALSLRGKKADIFWFTFFHELAHLIEHNRKEFHINFDKDEEEDEADKLASNYLINDLLYKEFLDNYNSSNKIDIINYASKIKIAPCILVGRLLHDKYIDYNFASSLRPSFEIIRN